MPIYVCSRTNNFFWSKVMSLSKKNNKYIGHHRRSVSYSRSRAMSGELRRSQVYGSNFGPAMLREIAHISMAAKYFPFSWNLPNLYTMDRMDEVGVLEDEVKDALRRIRTSFSKWTVYFIMFTCNDWPCMPVALCMTLLFAEICMTSWLRWN